MTRANALSTATNDAYIADGYGNHRVIVFDADREVQAALGRVRRQA